MPPLDRRRRFAAVQQPRALAKLLFLLSSALLVALFVHKFFFYVYRAYDLVQPPWPSKPANMVEYEQIASSHYYRPKILCWISTYPRNRLKSEAVRATWGQDCDWFFIMSSRREDYPEAFCPEEYPFSSNFGRTCCRRLSGQEDIYNEFCRHEHSTKCQAFVQDPQVRCGNHKSVEAKPYIFLPVSGAYHALWEKTKMANLWLANADYLDQADFVIKADDDTHVDVTKLRSILGRLSKEDAIFMGYALKWKQRCWMSGGAGYVLSAKTFRDLIAFLKRDHDGHLKGLQEVAEDAMMGWLMSRLGASFLHLRIGGVPSFLPIPLHSLQLGLLKKDQEWFRQLSWDQSWQNLIERRSFVVTQHYVSPSEMFTIQHQNEFLDN